MDIKHLAFFLTISEMGSINQAATRLFISQQGLNRIIHNLEGELGVKLFTRTPQGVQLTAHGKTVQKYAEKIVENATDMQDELGFIDEGVHDQVWVVFGYAVLEQLNFSFMNPFRLANNDIDLMIGEYPYSVAEKMVATDKFDLGFGYTPIDDAKFEYVSIMQAPWPLLVHRSNPLAQKKSATCADLTGQNFFMMSSNFKGRNTFIQRCKDLNLSLNVVGVVNNLSETYQLVKENKGIAFSLSSVEKEMDDPDVVTIRFDDEVCRSSIVMFHKKGGVLRPAARRFYDYVLGMLPFPGASG